MLHTIWLRLGGLVLPVLLVAALWHQIAVEPPLAMPLPVPRRPAIQWILPSRPHPPHSRGWHIWAPTTEDAVSSPSGIWISAPWANARPRTAASAWLQKTLSGAWHGIPGGAGDHHALAFRPAVPAQRLP
jgi:hypothetical protein